MQDSGEKCDAAFLEDREPSDCRVCRNNFLGKCREKFLAKLFWERSRKYFLCARNFLEKFSLGKSMHAIQISLKKQN
jgi:hypothetical protein